MGFTIGLTFIPLLPPRVNSPQRFDREALWRRIFYLLAVVDRSHGYSGKVCPSPGNTDPSLGWEWSPALTESVSLLRWSGSCMKALRGALGLCFSSPSVSAWWSRLTASSFWKEAPSVRPEPTNSSWRIEDTIGPWCRLLVCWVLQNERLLRPARSISLPFFPLLPIVRNLGTKVLTELQSSRLLLGETSWNVTPRLRVT